MINILKNIIPKKYHQLKWIVFANKLFRDIYKNISYSQEGEDLILKRIFEGKKTGFYVDVGAHHPKRFSNTYVFYKMGWHGINIDAMPGSMKKFNKSRKRDINIEAGISNSSVTLKYYVFEDKALNTFKENLAKEHDKKTAIIKSIPVITYKLSDILDKYLPDGQIIDFLSIDVEGFDEEVLKSNDWVKFCPACILVEIAGIKIEDVDKHEIIKFLRQYNYRAVYKTFNTVFFKRVVELC